MKSPDVQEKYTNLGISTAYSSPQAVTERAARETPRMGQVLKAAGVEPE